MPVRPPTSRRSHWQALFPLEHGPQREGSSIGLFVVFIAAIVIVIVFALVVVRVVIEVKIVVVIK